MQKVYRVYEGAREPHRLAVERTAEVLGRGGLALIPTETVYGVAVAVNAFSDAVPQDTSEFPSWPRDPQAAVNYAIAASILKLTIKGDSNLVTADEIAAVASAADGGTRVAR